MSTVPEAQPRPIRQIPPKQKEDYEPHTPQMVGVGLVSAAVVLFGGVDVWSG